jgi:hypothetical protein
VAIALGIVGLAMLGVVEMVTQPTLPKLFFSF